MSAPSKPALRTDVEAVLGVGADAPTSRPGRRLLAWSAAGLAGTLVLLLLTQRNASTAVQYVTEPVQRGDITAIVTATGSVQPKTKVDVSSELSGTVRKVLVDFNSPVHAGQTLAELDTDKLKATVEASRAKLAAAQARVVDAEATVVEKEREISRKRELTVRKVASSRDLEIADAAFRRAVAAVASAKAEVDVAAADLKLNEMNLSKACICAPIDGIVLKRSVDPGQTVASSFQAPVLFSIAEDLKQMELQVDVDEADVGRVAVGQGATFTVDAYPDRRFPAVIRDVRYASETVQGVVTYKAVLTVGNAELLLRPGMTATAEIRVEQLQGVLTVPNEALRFTPPVASDTQQEVSFLRRLLPGPPIRRPPSKQDATGQGRRVFVLSNGGPKAVPVAVGASDGRRTAIVKGDLAVDQAVVVDTRAAKR